MTKWFYSAMAAALFLAVAVEAADPPLAPGQLLPAFSGDNLAGLAVTLPGAARGKVALIAFGFSYDSRTPVEAWTEHVRAAWGAEAGFNWYQVPMIGGFGRLAKPFINGGMKKATPPQFHGNAVTVFGGVGPWRVRLSVKNDALAYLVLIDRGGVVRWLHAGPYDTAFAAELDNQVRWLLASEPAVHAAPAGHRQRVWRLGLDGLLNSPGQAVADRDVLQGASPCRRALDQRTLGRDCPANAALRMRRAAAAPSGRDLRLAMRTGSMRVSTGRVSTECRAALECRPCMITAYRQGYPPSRRPALRRD